MGAERAIEILLVEDSSDDALLVRTALAEGRVANRLHIVDNGDDALAFLRRGRATPSLRPDLVLLDLNLPGVDGREVLAEIKGDPDLRTIPVVVMTTSVQERDILHAYDLSANAYVQKPLDLGAFLDVMRGIEDFWLSIVRLPGRRDDP